MTRQVQNKKEGGRDFLCRLWNRVGVQCGHLVGRGSLSVGLILAGRAAHCGSVGWGGCEGCGGGYGTAAAGEAGYRGGLLLFGLLAGELCDAEEELEAAQLDVAAVVQQRRALPPRPAASYQAGAACLAAARQLAPALRLAAHHSSGREQPHHGAGTLVILALLTATCSRTQGDVGKRVHTILQLSMEQQQQHFPLSPRWLGSLKFPIFLYFFLKT